MPIGRRQDGTPWTHRLIGTHLLVAGATGSGKGSVVWSLIRAMGRAIRDRSVEVWAIDPKGGMELNPGAGLFTRFAYADPASMVELLEDAVALMRDRAERLRLSGLRSHTPSVADPLVVVVVDEMAALTAYCGDRELKKRAESALQLLLSQGGLLASSSWPLCRIPARTWSASGTCSRLGWRCGCLRTSRSTWCSAARPGSAARSATRSRRRCPVSATS